MVSYYQLAENVWDPERHRARPRIVYNFGRADPASKERLRRLARSILRRVSPDEIVATDPTVQIKDSWPHGDFYVLSELWDLLGLRRVFEKHLREADRTVPLERALFAMVANRCIKPSSKLSCWEQWMRDEIYFPDGAEIQLHHLYRAMDVLEWNKEEIERQIFSSVADLLSLDVDLIFYDTTSVHFEIEAEDVHERCFRGRTQEPLRKRGHSKNRRTDVPQIVVAMAVTRDGLPVRSWVFPGNTNDRVPLKEVKKDLRGWRLGRCVFVSDAGTVSAENLKVLSASGGSYIVCMPMRLGDEVTKEVLGRQGRYKKICDNLHIKEVCVPPNGEGRRRYVVCRNVREAERTRQKREDILAELEAELKALARSPEKHPKKACELMAAKQYRPYLKKLKSGRLAIDRAKVRAAERFDGKWVVHSNDDSLTAEDLALGYKQLMTVEVAWRDLKSVLRLRPVHHHSPHRIKAHVTICVLALLLQRVVERGCEETWPRVRHRLRRIKATALLTSNGELVQTNLIDPEAGSALKALKIKPPPEILAAR
jgi:transposase